MEEIIGLNLSPSDMELRGMRIDPAHREGEAGLLRKRWFDYRGLHPVAATYLYAHHYVLQTRKFYTENIDARTADSARAFVPDDVFMSRDLTSMWLARRATDALGIPYPFALQFAHTRFINRLQPRFPRPNQLYGEEFEADLSLAWKERVAMELTFSTQPRYRASAFKRDLDLAQHLKFVIDQIKARPAPHHRLLARMFSQDILSPTLAAGRFTQQEISAAEAYRAQFV